MARTGHKFAQKRIALERIETLFAQAAKRPSYAKRYLALARAISQRTKTPIPRELKLRLCKGCNAYLTAQNSTTRIKNKMKTITCNDCKTTKRIPLRKQ
ncbi:ribonuclease P [Candidatus Woesearchaeota archaeon]|nr:MAG: ribonuclease P [Candidatus Woesearchaeota archaeon]